MNNMLQTVIPKSDQLNADDLIGGKTLTIKVTKVSLVNGDQPVAINYEGDNGKPYKPCKSMRRVLIHAWGGDGAQYVGRSMTLYCDPTVKFGGADVGGIRISHLSNIEREMTMALTATRANRKPFTVQPLKVSAPIPDVSLDDYISMVETAIDADTLKAKFSDAHHYRNDPNFYKLIEAKDKRKAELAK